jgi:hypothetical protein
LAEEHSTIIPQLLAEDEQTLIRDWLKSQKKSGALRSGQIGEAERAAPPVACSPLCTAAQRLGQFEGITAPVWDQSRTVLEEVSRSRPTLG